MKTYKQVFLLFSIGIFIIPQIALAAWWNPLSWSFLSKIFHRNPPTSQIIEAAPVITKDVQVDASSTNIIGNMEAERALLDSEQKRLQTENEKLKTENEITKQKLETARSEAARQLLQEENDKLKAQANLAQQKPADIDKGFPCNGQYYTQSCGLGKKLACPASGAATCVGDSDILCNGKYWAQCPVGHTFVCPQSGNASCSAPKSSVDLNKAAKNKAELMNLQNMDINMEKQLLELSTKEVARANNILNQLTGYYGGEAYTVIRNLTIAERVLFEAYQQVDTSMIEYAEKGLRSIEAIDVSGFADEAAMTTLRNNVNKNISNNSQEIYKRQGEIASYNDTMRASVPTLNLNP